MSHSRIEGFPSLLNYAINNATKLITGNSGGYVVLHSAAKDGKPYELLVMDKPNLDDAVKVWRWNVSGLGYSKTDITVLTKLLLQLMDKS